jgi:hypothetical protein
MLSPVRRGALVLVMLAGGCGPPPEEAEVPIVMIEPTPSDWAVPQDEGGGEVAVRRPDMRVRLAAPTCRKQATTRLNQEVAKKLFREGTAQFARGDFRAAAVAFETADCLVPGAQPKWNIGQCYEKLGDRCRALEWYKLFLAGMGTKPSASLRMREPEVRKRIAALEAGCRR